MPPRALVIDDHPINSELCVFLLESDGFEVKSAADSEEAERLIREFAPSVIIMDINLPGKDGLTLTRQLRADPANREVCVIAATSYAMTSDEEKAYEAGCNGYVKKPLSTRDFAAYVRRCMAQMK